MSTVLRDPLAYLDTHFPIGALWLRNGTVKVHFVQSDTFYTDGASVFCGDKALSEWSIENIAFVLMHELYHIWLNHIGRGLSLGQNIDRNRLNIAFDYEVNNRLSTIMPVVPSGAFLNSTYLGMPGERIYHLIDSEDKRRSRTSSLSGDLNKAAPADPMDIALVQVAMAKSVLANSGPGPGTERARWEARKIMAGADHRSWDDRLLSDEVGKRPDGSSYSTPDRRFLGRGMILPGRRTERVKMARLALYIDCSGSMDGKALDRLAGEVEAIMAADMAEEIQVIAWNGSIVSDIVYRDGDTIDYPKSGCGGTSIAGPLRHLRKHQDKISRSIVLSDMEFTMPHGWKADLDLDKIIWVQYGDAMTGLPPDLENVVFID